MDDSAADEPSSIRYLLSLLDYSKQHRRLEDKAYELVDSTFSNLTCLMLDVGCWMCLAARDNVRLSRQKLLDSQGLSRL